MNKLKDIERKCEVCKKNIRDCEGMIDSFLGKICIDCDYKAFEHSVSKQIVDLLINY